MTLIEQLTDQVACWKNYREGHREPQLREFCKKEIARFNKLLRTELKALAAAIRQHGDLAERLNLIESVDGVGLKTAVAILVRMPEIGRLTREQAAALAGLAPYDDDSATHLEYVISPAVANDCAAVFTRQHWLRPFIGIGS